MKKNIIFGLATLSTLTLSAPAMAGANDLLTLGLGASYTYTNTQGLSEGSGMQSSAPSLNVRLKLLRVFGAELSYAPSAGSSQDGDLVGDSTVQASGLLFLLPTEYVGVYGKAGIGSQSFAEMGNPGSASTSYHAGGGFDVHLGDNLAIGAEMLVLIPGAASIDAALSKHGLRSTNENLGTGVQSTDRSPVELQMSDLITTDNYQASLSLRYYF